MGTTLTGTTPQDTYDSLIKVTDNGPLSGTAKYLSDGLGNDSALALSTGNIGIGTLTPDSKLDVTGGNITINTIGTTFADFKYGTVGSETSRGSITTDGLDLTINATVDLILSPVGNVGIGTNTPAVKLHVKGTAETGSVLRLEPTTSTTIYSQVVGVNGDIQIQADPLNNEGSSAVKMYVDGSEIIRVTTDGLAFGPFAAANALDDYEEGTWTPTDGSGAALSFTLNGTAIYTKIGRVVTLRLDITYPSTVDASNMNIAGLPFVCLSDYGASIGFTDIVPAASTFCQLSGNTQGFRLQNTGGTTFTNATMSTKRVQLSATYFV